MFKKALCLTALSALLIGSGTPAQAQCSSSGSRPAQVAAEKPATIVATASAAGQFNTLLQAATAAGLVEVLQGEGPYTVFAPTDAAFAKLPPGTLEALLKDPVKLKAILTYHVVPGRLTSDKVLAGAPLKTVQGQTLTASKSDSGVTIDTANLVKADIPCSNGVIHVIDAVVLPK